jgi:crotonobetainyl-CoA:carnitine CoA-transferase CaiB-like acyl-CoA transferase
MSGLMIDQGEADSVPIVIPGLQMYDAAGVQAAFGILVALLARDTHGGQSLSVATHEVLSTQLHHITRYGLFGAIPERTGAVVVPPSGNWTVSDGVVSLQVWEPRQWDSFVKLIGNPPELQAPHLKDRIARRQEAQWLEGILARVLAEHTVDDLVERANAAGVPCSRVNHAADLWNDRQLRARGFFQRLSVEGNRSEEYPGPPYRLPSGWWSLRRPAPGLGQHNRDVYVDELGFSESDLVRWRQSGLV